LELEKKLDEVYARCKKHIQSIQCKFCGEYFKNDDFIAHTQTRCHEIVAEPIPDIQLTITQTLIKEDENTHKPYTEYVIVAKSEGKKWIINRRYKQFCVLNFSLQKNFPKLTFPESSKIFSSKTLTDIKRDSVVDGRRKLLQNYINDVAKFPEVRSTTKFKNFVGVLTKQVDKDDLVLPTASIEDIFDNSRVGIYKDP
jgi:hypothetical protein